MTLDEARGILGLGVDEDPSSHLKDFQEARERIAEMVRAAPNQVLTDRYQAGLTEFDRALEVVKTHLAITGAPAPATPHIEQIASTPAIARVESVESTPVQEPTMVAEIAPAPEAPAPVEPLEAPATAPVAIPEVIPVEKIEPSAPAVPIAKVVAETAVLPVPESAKTSNLPIDLPEPVIDLPSPAPIPLPEPEPAVQKRGSKFLAWCLVLLLLAVAAGFIYLKLEEDKRAERQGEVRDFEKQGASYVETRRWNEAREVHDKIEQIEPGSEIAARLRRSIDAGIEEELQQFLQYWNGEALAAFESNRLDEAEAAVKQVLSKSPTDAAAIELQGKIVQARSAEKLRLALEDARKKFEAKDWSAAITAAQAILATVPEQPEAKSLLADATAAKTKAEVERARALELFTKAKERDKGQFDAEALEWVREAAVLAPDNAEIKALFEKFSSYTRTLRVPGDFATPAEALAGARDRDRIVIEAGSWAGPLVVNAAIELQGAGSGKSIVECPASNSVAISFGPGAKGARVTGMTFRHSTLDPENQRFSAAQVRGGEVTFTDCHFLDAAGHGLVVMEGGKAIASRCRFHGNGWDGASANGAGSFLEVRDSEASGNYEHGLDLWDGAGGTLTANRCDNNSRNGIQVDAAAPVSVTGNQLKGNHEFGIVLAKGTAGKVNGNILTDNLLGGLVVRSEATKFEVAENKITSGAVPAIVLEKGVARTAYATNQISNNSTKPVLEGVDFKAE